ncbi:hypothetical protein ACFPT7_02160 [Acidicapsa dinghuensis]|uniref:Uncharacterized protein n=1 Tax=Acidicapsa dinghuensis TaxID=2218256 RepID=A0ABW1EAV6_9BACT|nr:hypothetical protein [Acidicapsa dinghuensis]
MAPTAIDDEKLGGMKVLDLSKPQGYAQGLPVKQIPHQEYPRVIYKHPNAPFYVEEHRNVNHEVVHREVKSADHRTHVCKSKSEHEQKLAEGWKNEPYIQLAPPDPMDDLYAEVIAADIARKSGQPQTETEFDPAAAQRFLRSRGYKSETPEDAAEYVKAMAAKDRRGFLKQLAEFVATGEAK